MGFVTRWEDYLIPYEQWEELRSKMPVECQNIIDEPLCCVGIGHNEELGWFIAGSGQGPCVFWQEKGNK